MIVTIEYEDEHPVSGCVRSVRVSLPDGANMATLVAAFRAAAIGIGYAPATVDEYIPEVA